jgi:hypothetical protein
VCPQRGVRARVATQDPVEERDSVHRRKGPAGSPRCSAPTSVLHGDGLVCPPAGRSERIQRRAGSWRRSTCPANNASSTTAGTTLTTCLSTSRGPTCSRPGRYFAPVDLRALPESDGCDAMASHRCSSAAIHLVRGYPGIGPPRPSKAASTGRGSFRYGLGPRDR